MRLIDWPLSRIAIEIVLMSCVCFPSLAQSTYANGTISNVCGPTDAIEISLILTEKPLDCAQEMPRRYLMMSLNGPFPKTVKFPTRNARTQVYRCDVVNKVIKCEPAAAGEITIDKSGREGNYELKFEDEGVQSGDFHVKKCMTRIYCG